MPAVDRAANHHHYWSIRLLGGFGLSGPTGRIEVPPAGQRLVAYLAIQGHSVRRSTVAAAIWPDVDEARARANLRSTVCRLGALAPVVDATAASLSIAPDVLVDVDDLQLQVLAARSGEMRPIGPRPGFDLELLPGWEEEWVELERERVRQLELHLLDDVVSASVQDGRHGDGVDAALRAIRLDPLARVVARRAAARAAGRRQPGGGPHALPPVLLADARGAGAVAVARRPRGGQRDPARASGPPGLTEPGRR